MKKLKQRVGGQKPKKKSLREVFDGFIPEKSADELIIELKNARISTRKVDKI
ncbi:hypothetical protein [Mucilaginibacter psychrotolerans]|uniref:hypothetical protein n=1 Tax=Mucilaginibacter psychrotolerans TaxID=1524096 RepID=UPI00130508FE|nr:hypothetical protein [Mucilaginibacter psychrotolerans]